MNARNLKHHGTRYLILNLFFSSFVRGFFYYYDDIEVYAFFTPFFLNSFKIQEASSINFFSPSN